MSGEPAGAATRGWPWLADHEAHPRLGNARPVIAESGMVTTPHHLATGIGREVLRAGGNAVDAAIAASAALMVTVPMQCSPGGDAIWLISTPGNGIEVLNASGRSPAGTGAEALRRKGLSHIPHRSADAVTVPGAVDGWRQAAQRYGTRPLSELLEPATKLAEHGFFVSRHLHASFSAALPVLKQWRSLSFWTAGDTAPALYDRLRQPELATTLRRIGETNGADFYHGDLASGIAATVQAAGGVMTEADLADHRSDWQKPVSARFRSATVYTSGPSTQGAALLLALQVAEQLSPEPIDVTKAAGVHVLVEAVAAALEQRDACIADPAAMRIDVQDLISPSRARAAAATLDASRAAEKKRNVGSTKGKGDTAHLAVVDRDGLAVSLIQSVFFDFGTGIPVPGAGFTLQNRGAAFSLQPGAVAELRPGQRPPHTLHPSMVHRDGRLSHVLGCMGGDGQVQTQTQLLVAMLDNGLDPQQAVSSPRWYLDRADADVPMLLAEDGLGTEMIQGLRKMGHRVTEMLPSEEIMGHAQVIEIAATGALIGAADPRSDGQASGW